MTQKITLNALLRVEKNSGENDYIPAVVYGGSKDNQSLKIKKNDFDKVYGDAGGSVLIDLAVKDGDTDKVIIKDVQKDALKNSIRHVDFYRVNMKNKLEVEIPLNFINESDAVKNLGGILIKNIESVKAVCLPGDLMESIDVDLALLKDFSDIIKVKDLNTPSSIEILNDGEEMIATASEPKLANHGQKGTEGGEAKEGEVKEEGASAEEQKTEEGK